MIRVYLALIGIDIRLAFREKTVVFFNYLMPFAFFFIFAQAYHAEQGGAILQVVTMVAVLGTIGNGLFGGGMRTVQEREANILRRYKVAPISPLPLLVASTITGLVVYLPFIAGMLFLAHVRYGMRVPSNVFAIICFIVLGVVAIRAIGLIIASVVNSMQEVTVLVQIVYMTMLFLSGTTFPVTMFPGWLLVVSQFIPATWLVTGLQGLLIRHESLAVNWQPIAALLLTAATGLFLSVKLFRWEKEEKMRPAAKLWLVAVLMPFLVLGAWQVHAEDNLREAKILEREAARSRNLLIRHVRIFVGDGDVIEDGGILVRDGKIAEVYRGAIPDPRSLRAAVLEGAGKTVLPGLIDVHAHLGQSGGFLQNAGNDDPIKTSVRELAAYLYCGVTAVKSLGDLLDPTLKVRAAVASGEKQGAELFMGGPMFTAEGGRGTEYFEGLPDVPHRQLESQLLRMPKTAGDARQQVDALHKAGVDGITAIMEAGAGGRVFQRLDPRILAAIAAEARAAGLPIMVHTGDIRDVEDALRAGVNGIEHGSARERIPDSDFALMVRGGVAYDPTLSVGEAYPRFAAGDLDLMDRSLVRQSVPAKLLSGTRALIDAPAVAAMRQSIGRYPADLNIARDNLLRAWKAGVNLVTGSDAGNPLVFHGPTVQHEIMLWVEAGLPPRVALGAATLAAARSLRAEARIGSIERGKEATLLVVDGNPLEDIKAAEAISAVMFRGERINRGALVSQE